MSYRFKPCPKTIYFTFHTKSFFGSWLRLREIIKSTRLHEYKARLALANLEDGFVDSSYNMEARLVRLEAHQEAWKGFCWRRSKPPILVRLFSLSDGKSHPPASFPSIHVANLPAPLDRWKFIIQICGHTLAIMADPKEKHASGLEPQLSIVNWKTGRILKKPNRRAAHR
ncbi:hypothetical protein WG66_005761 [Moniliophthora roreri]|nr:hypothetical protein WG66_005761 [Moniliophthora roreri]